MTLYRLAFGAPCWFRFIRTQQSTADLQSWQLHFHSVLGGAAYGGMGQTNPGVS